MKNTLQDILARQRAKRSEQPLASAPNSLAALRERLKAKREKAEEWQPAGEVHTLRLKPDEDAKRILAKARACFPRLMVRPHPKKALQLQVCGKAEAEWLQSMLPQFTR